MQKQKILYLITKSNWGGAQRYVFDLATNIDKERYEPVIALGGTGELYDRLRAAGLKVISIKHLGRDVSLWRDLLVLFRIFRIIQTERPDVLHVNSSKIGLFGSLAGRVLGIRRVLFTALAWAFNEERPAWQKVVIKTLQWLTVLFAHQTIALSHGVKRDLDWPLVQRKMTVVHLGRNPITFLSRGVPNGIRATKITNSSTSLYEHQNDVWIGSISELHKTKGLDVALDAVALLVTEFPHLRYVMIHDGDERDRLRAQVERLQLQHNVFFAGIIPEAARLIPAFDLFILPSRSEAFGYVLLEAGQAGVPVVASNVGGIPDVIEHEQNGLLVPPNDPVALASAMKQILTDQQQAKQLAANNQQRASTFSLDHMLEKTVAIYR